MKVLLSLLLVMFWCNSVFAFMCERYEYAEIKDMTKDELINNYNLSMEGFYKLQDPKYLQIYEYSWVQEQGNCLDAAKQYERILIKSHKVKKQYFGEINTGLNKKYTRTDQSEAP